MPVSVGSVRIKRLVLKVIKEPPKRSLSWCRFDEGDKATHDRRGLASHKSLESLLCDRRQYLRDDKVQAVIVVELHEQDRTKILDPMLNETRIRVFGKVYELPVGELTEDVTKAIEDEKIKRVIDRIGQHITREKQDLFRDW